MGIRLIFLNLRQMRWGDGAWKIIRVLEVPVVERRRSAGKSADASPRQRHVPPRRRSDRKCFQEKPLSPSLMRTVPQTDTGGRAEYAQALERTREKELGKLTP